MNLRIFRMIALSCLACSGWTASASASAAASARPIDVRLTADGQLLGAVSDPQGLAAAGASVAVLTPAGARLQTLTTDQRGQFRAVLTPGTYVLSTTEGGTLVRVWQHRTAPPSAGEGVWLVPGSVTRGQGPGGFRFASLRPFLLPAAIVGGTAGLIAGISSQNDGS